MATRFVTNLDLVQNQILNGRFETVPTDPTSDNFDGRLIYNSTEGVVKVYDEDYVPASGETKWRKFVTKVTSSTTALSSTESNGVITLSVDDVVSNGASGLMTGTDKKKLDDATAADSISTLVIRDGSGRFQVATPSADLDAANKGYVDSARAGLDVKASVKVATTEAITLSTDLAPGDLIDGYELVTGDRVLVKNQDTASENGIYNIQSDGSVVRAADADSNAEVTPGLFTFVEQGTLNADSGWVLITDGTIAVGSTPLEFSLFSVAGNILAGAGLSKTGDTLDVNVDNVGIAIVDDEIVIKSYTNNGITTAFGTINVNLATNSGLGFSGDAGAPLNVILAAEGGLSKPEGAIGLASTVAGDGITLTSGVLSVDAVDLTGTVGNGVTGILPIANGGTNASVASDARTNLAATSPTGANTTTPVLARVASKVVGDGASTSFAVTHNFGTRAVVVQVFDSSSFDTVIADVVRTTTDTVTVSFSVAPATNSFTVVVTG